MGGPLYTYITGVQVLLILASNLGWKPLTVLQLKIPSGLKSIFHLKLLT